MDQRLRPAVHTPLRDATPVPPLLVMYYLMRQVLGQPDQSGSPPQAVPPLQDPELATRYEDPDLITAGVFGAGDQKDRPPRRAIMTDHRGMRDHRHPDRMAEGYPSTQPTREAEQETL